jgi:phospholipase A1
LGSPRFNQAIDGTDLPLKLERHKRMYFISGLENTKVQISAKIPVFYGSKLYVAYTETGFWKLFQKSSNPFEDINHNPELFYRWSLQENHMLDLGVEHLSNGSDKANSRSWNDLYVQSMSKFDSMYFTSKAYYLWDVDATNEDIKKYLGFIDMEIGFKELIRSKFQSNELYFRWRPGANLSFDGNGYNTFEIGLKIKFSDFKYFQHFFVNYYNGYAENQLAYDRYTRALRIGLIF